MGMHRYNERGAKLVKAELKKIYGKLTFAPIKKIALTQKKCADMIQALMLLKVKQYKKVNVRI